MTAHELLGIYAMVDMVSVVFIAIYLMRVGRLKAMKSLPMLSSITILLTMQLYLLIFGIYFIIEENTDWLIRKFHQEQLANFLAMLFVLVVVLFSVIVVKESEE